MVDGIGKGGPKIPPTTGTPTTGVGGPSKVGETGRTFEVQKTQQTQSATGPSPAEQLRSGQISVDQYLDMKVNEATAHLKGLTPVQLDAIKNMLRDQISTDPALADLFQKATGHAPPASDE